ncbi:MAG: ABC transporter ATP-binding protein [Bacilli bacterium]
MSNLQVFKRFIKISFKEDKAYFFAIIFQSIYSMGLTLFNVYSLKLILDSVVAKSYQDSLIIGLFVVIVNLVLNFLSKLSIRLVDVGRIRLAKKLNLVIGKKLMAIPYSYLEDPYYLDLKERAKFASENQGAVSQFLRFFTNLLQYSFTLISLAIVIITFDFWIMLILVVAVILNLLINVNSMKFMVKFFQELIPINRRFTYLLALIYETKYSKDSRLYSIGSLMVDRFTSFKNKTCQYFKKLHLQLNKYESLNSIVNYIQIFLVYLIIAINSFNEKLGAGNFTFYITSAITFSKVMNDLVNSIVSLRQYCEYLNPFVELMDLKEEKDEGEKIPFEGTIETIEFKDVSFKYPKTENLILQNISFKISKGQKISIVGLNGAGKTTLIKLLCRLYKPTSGEILINDINIKDYEYKTYIKQISAVFQDFKLFAYSISENITNENNQEDLAFKYAVDVGLKDKIESLKYGIKSKYSKAYDQEGVELSGGEAQKVAIARALYKKSSLVILDEPTSALDPLAEADIYMNFNNLVKEKTAIYISHRMSSSTFCDKVLVINGGKVEAYDTHKNLMKNKESLYYKLFNSQAKNYALEKELLA